MPEVMHVNHLGQPVGSPLPGWRAPPPPPRVALAGRTCTLEPLDPTMHTDDLFAAYALDGDGRNYTYLSYGPFSSLDTFRAWVEQAAVKPDPFFHAIIDTENRKAVGVASYMRIDPDAGSIEVGSINYSPLLQRTVAATESMYLMMRQAFALGYRRYEWKCDSCNEPSRQAAARLGFTYEGRFRQATTYKGRNRDTDWFSIIDSEWPRLKQGFEAWLDPRNFDAQGRQLQSLGALCKSVAPD